MWGGGVQTFSVGPIPSARKTSIETRGIDIP